jgi:hypothetical protein
MKALWKSAIKYESAMDAMEKGYEICVQCKPNLETCESDISPKPYSRLTIPPPPSLTYA